MNRLCEPVETLAQAERLPRGDARRDHMDECARCRARLEAYHAFMTAEEEPAGADLGDASGRLRAFMKKEIYGEESATVEGSRSSPYRTGLFALAAVLVLALLVPRLTMHDDLVPGAALRGDADLDAFQNTALVSAEGELTLSWQPIAGADDYRVVLYDGSLVETATVRTAGRTELTLDRGTSKPVFWRVTALSGGDPMATSRAVAISPELPAP